jgi:solute carrier family 35 protein E3
MNTKLLLKVFYIIINIILSLSLIILNKWIYLSINFPNLSLTLIHFISTFIGLIISKSLNLFSPKPVSSVKSLLLLGVTFAGFVVLTNLSLQYNSIGSFQIIKTLTMPSIVIIETLIYGKVFSLCVKLSLVLININLLIDHKSIKLLLSFH